jgi:sugar lactone lactonase YvrE
LIGLGLVLATGLALSQNTEIGGQHLAGCVVTVLRDNSDEPAPDFVVTLHRSPQIDLIAGCLKSTVTDRDGRFIFRDLSPGEYWVAVWNYLSQLTRVVSGRVSRARATELPIIRVAASQDVYPISLLYDVPSNSLFALSDYDRRIYNIELENNTFGVVDELEPGDEWLGQCLVEVGTQRYVVSLGKSKLVAAARSTIVFTPLSTGLRRIVNHYWSQYAGVAFDSSNRNLLLVNSSTREIERLHIKDNLEFEKVPPVPVVFDPSANLNAICLLRDTIYVGDQQGGRVLKILPGDKSPSVLTRGVVYSSCIVAGMSGSEIFIADVGGRKILRCDLKTGNSGEIDFNGVVRKPTAIAEDRYGNLWVADDAERAIFKKPVHGGIQTIRP